MIRRGLLMLLVVLACTALLLYAAAVGWLGRDEVAGAVAILPRPTEVVAERVATQAASMRSLGASPAKQVLFAWSSPIYEEFASEPE